MAQSREITSPTQICGAWELPDVRIYEQYKNIEWLKDYFKAFSELLREEFLDLIITEFPDRLYWDSDESITLKGVDGFLTFWVKYFYGFYRPLESAAVYNYYDDVTSYDQTGYNSAGLPGVYDDAGSSAGYVDFHKFLCCLDLLLNRDHPVFTEYVLAKFIANYCQLETINEVLIRTVSMGEVRYYVDYSDASQSLQGILSQYKNKLGIPFGSSFNLVQLLCEFARDLKSFEIWIYIDTSYNYPPNPQGSENDNTNTREFINFAKIVPNTTADSWTATSSDSNVLDVKSIDESGGISEDAGFYPVGEGNANAVLNCEWTGEVTRSDSILVHVVNGFPALSIKEASAGLTIQAGEEYDLEVEPNQAYMEMEVLNSNLSNLIKYESVYSDVEDFYIHRIYTYYETFGSDGVTPLTYPININVQFNRTVSGKTETIPMTITLTED